MERHDPQDGKVKIGVQITPLDEILNHYKKEGGKIWIRRCNYKKIHLQMIN